MDILKLLLESTEDLCSEDLDFFETELAVGDYDGAYRAACKSEIQALRTQLHRLAAPPLKKREPKPGASSGFPEPASREAPPAPVSPAGVGQHRDHTGAGRLQKSVQALCQGQPRD